MEHRIPELIEQVFWSIYRGGGDYSLNPAQWAALRFFSSSEVVRKTSSEFAKYHQTTRGTANQTVLALMRKGYLQRSVSPNDHRSKAVSVTPAGFEALNQDPIKPLAETIEKLAPSEQELLNSTLADILSRLKASQKADR